MDMDSKSTNWLQANDKYVHVIDYIFERKLYAETVDNTEMEQSYSLEQPVPQNPQPAPIYFPKNIIRRSSSASCCRRRVEACQSKKRSQSQQSPRELPSDDIASLTPISSISLQGLDHFIEDELHLQNTLSQRSVCRPVTNKCENETISSLEDGEIPYFRLLKLNQKVLCSEMATQHNQPAHNYVNIESEYVQMEMIYKAQIARLTEELRFAQLNNKAHQKADQHRRLEARSLPNVFGISGDGNDDRNSTDRLFFAKMQDETSDLAQLVIQLRQRINRLSVSENELMRKLTDSMEVAKIAHLGQTKAEVTCRQLLDEMESSKVRFSAALEEQAERHRENVTQVLNQSDNRLQTLRTALLLAEGNVAETAARLEHTEQQLAEMMHSLDKAETEDRALREEKVKSTQFTQNVIANLSMKEERATHELCQLRAQISLDDNRLQELIRNLKAQLRETHDRAEKAETEVVDVTEAHIRLLSRVNSLEQQLRTKERDLANTVEQNAYELREIFEMTQAREAQLVSAMSTAVLEHEKQLAQASQLIDQHRSVLFRLREACKSGVDQFDVTVTRLAKEQRQLAMAAKTAEAVVDETTEHRRRLEEETVDHLNQTDHLSKQVWRLEESVREREAQIRVFAENEHQYQHDIKILRNEIQFLQNRMHELLPEETGFLMDRLTHGSLEIQNMFARIGN